MIGERLGIATELAQKREAVAARLSPAARHRHFPTVYARPLPGPTPSEKLTQDNARLKRRVTSLEKECKALTAKLEAMEMRNRVLALRGGRGEIPKDCEFHPDQPILPVVQAFCETLNNYGFRVHDEHWSVEHMRSARRMRKLAQPRQVCMWVVTRVCKWASLPMIGHVFGGRDHTTIMHGRDRSEEIMQEVPILAHIATEVMNRFRLNSSGGPA